GNLGGSLSRIRGEPSTSNVAPCIDGGSRWPAVDLLFQPGKSCFGPSGFTLEGSCRTSISRSGPAAPDPTIAPRKHCLGRQRRTTWHRSELCRSTVAHDSGSSRKLTARGKHPTRSEGLALCAIDIRSDRDCVWARTVVSGFERVARERHERRWPVIHCGGSGAASARCLSRRRRSSGGRSSLRFRAGCSRGFLFSVL